MSHCFFPTFCFILTSATQDNLWRRALSSVEQEATRVFDTTFIIGQKSYEGFEYSDFFQQVLEGLQGPPFWSNLTSPTEVSHRRDPEPTSLCSP